MMESAVVKERMGFMLYREPRADNYKRTAYYLVYKTISEHYGISLSKLKFYLKRKTGLTGSDVESALQALQSQDVFSTVVSWRVRNTPVYGIKDSSIMPHWLKLVEKENPELTGFDFSDVKGATQ